MNNTEVVTPTNRYCCDKCSHVYSPWLSNKCPKCKHKFTRKTLDNYTDIPLDFDYGNVNITFIPPSLPDSFK